MIDQPTPSDRVYLGFVQHLAGGHNGPRFGRIVPQVRSNADGTLWEGTVENAIDEFPSRGEVFWWDVPSSFAVGDCVQFRLVPHPAYDPPEKPEKFQARDALLPVEVLDLRRGWSEAHLRRQLTGNGVYIQTDPLVRTVMIWSEPERWVGPVAIEPGDGPHLWKLPEKNDLSGLECFVLPREVLRPVSLGGRRLFLPPTFHRGEPAGLRNWMPDGQLAKNLLSRIRHYDRKAFDALGVSYAVFDSYQSALERAGLTGEDLARYVAKKERIEELRSTMSSNRDLLEQAVSTFLHIPEVQEEIERRKQELYEEEATQQRKRIANELRNEEAALMAVRARQEAVQRDIGELEAQLADKEADLERSVAAFEAKLRQRLQELTAAPEEAFADFVVLRGLLGPVPGPSTPPARLDVPQPAADEGTARPPVRILGAAKDVVTAIGGALRGCGLPPTLARELHSAFVAGAAPIVVGASAYEALAAYARVVTGGNMVWIPVSPSILEPQDLLGRFEPGVGTIVPHPGGLLDVLIGSGRTGEPCLVVLEGFDRASAESYLLPLLECRSDAWSGLTGRAVPLVARGLLAPPNPYADVTKVAWPSSVLLALIPALGSSSFPTGESLWRHAAMVDCGDTFTRTIGASEQELSLVDPALWAEWREMGALEELRSPMRNTLQSLGGGGAQPAGALVTEAIYAAARTLSVPDGKSLELALKLSYLPSLREPADEQIQAVMERGVTTDQARRLREFAARLKG